MCQIKEFKGIVTGRQYDVERTDVEGETAESLYSRDPRSEVTQVLSWSLAKGEKGPKNLNWACIISGHAAHSNDITVRKKMHVIYK